jgi:hypothetical protein
MAFCGIQADGITTPGAIVANYLDLSCGFAGHPATIASVSFASYGTPPSGACGSYSTPPSCDAATTVATVSKACVGQATCRIWPNTTTFGDPCTGVKKELVVQALCSSGPGTATPGCDASRGACAGPTPPGPAPGPAPGAASVTIDWTAAPPAAKLATHPSLQVVAHAALLRDSPLHDKLFAALSALDVSHVRYVPWQPTPLLGVAALDPPTATTTSWNFTLLDEHFLDVWNAVEGGTTNLGEKMIPNFSTPPAWLYGMSWSHNTECTYANHCTERGYEKGTAPASAHGGLDALGEYYGRLLAWYTKGGFVDELGVEHKSGHFLNITTWEVYNEPDYEYHHTVQSYTQDFDAIVKGIRKFADPEHKIKFIGMNNPNIDPTATVVEWATYFLNASNHDPAVRDVNAIGSYIGYHAYPTPRMASPDDMQQMFAYVDEYMTIRVPKVQAVIDALQPGVRTMLDETGTLKPMAKGGLDDPLFWVASGSYWAYMWARGAALTQSSTTTVNIPVVGQSAFMDSPDREPGVTVRVCLCELERLRCKMRCLTSSFLLQLHRPLLPAHR